MTLDSLWWNQSMSHWRCIKCDRIQIAIELDDDTGIHGGVGACECGETLVHRNDIRLAHLQSRVVNHLANNRALEKAAKNQHEWHCELCGTTKTKTPCTRCGHRTFLAGDIPEFLRWHCSFCDTFGGSEPNTCRNCGREKFVRGLDRVQHQPLVATLPDYYGGQGTPQECIKVIEAHGMADGFYRGNMLKYTMRAGSKSGETLLQAIEKATDYGKRYLAFLRGDK